MAWTVRNRVAVAAVASTRTVGNVAMVPSGPAQRQVAPSGVDPAAEQPVAEPFPAPRLPALDRPYRPAQVPRRLLVGASFEVAEHDRRPVSARGAGRSPRGAAAPARRRLDAASLRRARPHLVRAGADGPRPTGHTRPSGRPPDAARDPANRGPRALGPCGPGPGTWPGRRPGRRASASTPRQTREHHRPVPLDQDREGQLGGLAPAVANRSRSWPSVRSPIAPTLKSVRSCRRIAPSFPIATTGYLRRPAVLPKDMSNVTAEAGGSRIRRNSAQVRSSRICRGVESRSLFQGEASDFVGWVKPTGCQGVRLTDAPILHPSKHATDPA